MDRKTWAVAAALLSAGMAQATCYSVYKADGTLLQESPNTPVNLSLPIGDTVPEKFGPGATMTVSDHAVYCKDRKEAQVAPASRKSLADWVRADGEKAEQGEQAAGGKQRAAGAERTASR